MEVIAFVGPAGTGKSYRAQQVARSVGAQAIIDDGLLIQGSKVWAGESAKNEQNKIQAVKRAIFNDPKHVLMVKSALEQVQPRRVLILGTSDEMVRRITVKLGIAAPSKVIRIEDVSTPSEIKKARHSRYNEGKHIVPVPRLALKPHYSGQIIDPLRGFFRKKKPQDDYMVKSVVRPAFSMYGKLLIADSAVKDIVGLICQEIKEIKNIININIISQHNDEKSIVIDVELVLFYGFIIKDVVRNIQTIIKQQIEYMTAMNVLAVNISVRRLAIK